MRSILVLLAIAGAIQLGAVDSSQPFIQNGQDPLSRNLESSNSSSENYSKNSSSGSEVNGINKAVALVVNNQTVITLGNHSMTYNAWQLADAKGWCKFISTTKEPDILLYNRLSKCGSTTMKMLFDKMSEDNGVISFAVPKDYWHNLDEDTNMRKSLINEINRTIKKSKGAKVIADGHWFQTRFDSAVDFEGKTFENIQLLRECKSRRHSKFLYGLLDNHESKVRNEKGGKAAVDRYREDYLKSKVPLEECLKSYDCLKGSTKFNHNDTEIIFLCGSQCLADFKKGITPTKKLTAPVYDVNIAADLNAHNPEVFSVIGVLDYLGEYIEMLECAYPDMLRGIFTSYKRDQTHGKTGSAAEVYTDAMKKILIEACDPNWNGFVPLFDKIKDSMLRRYLYMKKYKSKCCRRGRGGKAGVGEGAETRRFLRALVDYVYGDSE